MIEFRPQNFADYKGAVVFGSGVIIKDVRIFTQDLEYGVNTAPFQPFLVTKDKKWAIMVDVRVEDNRIVFNGQAKPPHSLSIDNMDGRFERQGIPVTIFSQDGNPSGVIFPKKASGGL